jgi:hypothetical protein
MNVPPKRPITLALVAFILSGHALLIPFFLVTILFADADAPIRINGEPALVGEYRLLLVLSFAGWWCVAATLAIGIWKRKKWIRAALTIVFFIPYAVAAVAVLIQGQFLMLLVDTVFAYLIWWYLYKKQSVVQFFDATS